MRNRDPIGLSYVIGQGPGTPKEMVSAAVLAEESGFSAVFVPEHYFDWEAPSILGAIAESTSRVKIGTGVVNPFTRYPSLIAMTAGTLDRLSRGRFILGLGSGGVIGSLTHGIPNEFAGQKFDYPLGHLRETVVIVRKLLAGERVTFHGKHYRLDNVQLFFGPSRREVPIYFGQQGNKMMELAGQIADGVLMTLCSTVPYVKDVIRRIEESMQKSGRRPVSVDFAARIITSLSHRPDEAVKRAKQVVGRVFIHPGARPVMETSGIHLDTEAMKKAVDSGRNDRLEQLVSDEVVHLASASGTRTQIADKIEEMRKAGVTLPLVVPIGRNYAEIIRALSSR